MMKVKRANTTSARAATNRPPSEISLHADEIARLWRLKEEIIAKRARRNEPTARLQDGRAACVFFDKVDKEALDRIRVLEHLVSLLEPETLDDVLTLAILLNREVTELFHRQVYDEEFPQGVPSFAKSRALAHSPEEVERCVDRLRNAMIRGLLKFASSPIAREDYVSLAWDGLPWAEELTTAETELAKLPRKLSKEPNAPDNSGHE